MRNTLVIISFFLLPFYGNAQNCLDMNDNEVVRLDKEGGPLISASIQDQDGLPICYADATSLALKTSLPGNPEISYLHLAFAQGDFKKAPINNKASRDSAFNYNGDGTRGNILIDSGSICDTIKAVQQKKSPGVCRRDDVALEKLLFNNKINSSEDFFDVQSKIVEALSEYYDVAKGQFGINPLVLKNEIEKKIDSFKNYKMAFDKLIEQKQKSYISQECQKNDSSNAELVLKNVMLRIYSYITNKYGSVHSSKIFDRSNIDDSSLLFFSRNLGTIYQVRDDELELTLSENLKESLKKNYIEILRGNDFSSDAINSFKDFLVSLRGEYPIKDQPEVVDKIMNELSSKDKQQLAKDYNRYVKKDLSECIQKNDLLYFMNNDGLVKDFGENNCLKGYLNQGLKLKEMAVVLNDNNFSNIKDINHLIENIPSMSYEEAMMSIVAPDCVENKKIPIPDTLACQTYPIHYGILKSKRIEIALEFKKEMMKIESEHAKKLAQLVENSEMRSLEKRKEGQKKEVNEALEKKMVDQLNAMNEGHLWNKFLEETKNKFALETLNLLKNKKQAVPIGVCPKLFDDPHFSYQRNGVCGKMLLDGTYTEMSNKHAVVVIGVRCQKGTLDYLIQNSWGEWAGIKKVKNPDGSPHFESEIGKAWIKADELVNNITEYTLLSAGPVP